MSKVLEFGVWLVETTREDNVHIRFRQYQPPAVVICKARPILSFSQISELLSGEAIIIRSVKIYSSIESFSLLIMRGNSDSAYSWEGPRSR